MKLGVGLLVASVALLAFSCGKSGSGDDDDSTGGTTGGVSQAGSGGSRPAGGGGQASGSGGAAAGSAQSGSGSGNASGTGGTAGAVSQGGTAGTSAGTSGSSGAGHAGDGDTGGAGGAGDATGSATLFVMFDRSWSMNECGDGTETMAANNVIECPGISRWELTSTALIQFFQDPAAANLNVALRFFPDDNPAVGCDGYPTTGSSFPPPDGGDAGAGSSDPDAGTATPNCDFVACSEPLVPEAPLSANPAPLDAQEAALVAAVMSSTPPPGDAMPNPNPQTPTYAALGGATQWAVAYRQAHPDEPTAIVLITDGEPQGCDTNNTNIANLAAGAYESADVRTYVIGLTGSSEAGLNAIAFAGGTVGGFFVSDGNAAAQDLLDALATIRSRTR